MVSVKKVVDMVLAPAVFFSCKRVIAPTPNTTRKPPRRQEGRAVAGAARIPRQRGAEGDGKV